MAIEFFWRLSTTSPQDGRRGEWRAGDRPWARPTDARSRERQINRYDYLAQVARGAELTGFDGLVIPDDPDGEEPWIVTGALLRDVPRLKLATTVTPGAATALYSAKMASSVQRFSGGRQVWAIDLSADEAQRRRTGDFIADDDVGTRVGELADILHGVWGPGPYSREGRFFMVENGGLGDLVRQVPPPPLHFRGADDRALALSAALGSAHLFDHGPLDVLRAQADRLRAAAAGREIGLGISIPLLACETAEDVAAERARRALPGQALVGTYDDVAERIAGYVEAGFTLFELTADRQIEEVYIAGEQIVSRLRKRFTPFVRTAA